MKKLASVLFVFLLTGNGFSQNVAINSTGAAANASAILDVSSTTGGFLAPRMTTIQRTAIASPATGLMVYDTDLGCYYIYNGTGWKSMCEDDPAVFGETTTLFFPGVTTLLKTVVVTTQAGDQVKIDGEYDFSKGSASAVVALCLYRNGIEIHEVGNYSVANADNTTKITWIDSPGAGTHTYTLTWYRLGAGTTNGLYGSNLVCTVANQ